MLHLIVLGRGISMLHLFCTCHRVCCVDNSTCQTILCAQCATIKRVKGFARMFTVRAQASFALQPVICFLLTGKHKICRRIHVLVAEQTRYKQACTGPAMCGADAEALCCFLGDANPRSEYVGFIVGWKMLACIANSSSAKPNHVEQQKTYSTLLEQTALNNQNKTDSLEVHI